MRVDCVRLCVVWQQNVFMYASMRNARHMAENLSLQLRLKRSEWLPKFGGSFGVGCSTPHHFSLCQFLFRLPFHCLFQLFFVFDCLFVCMSVAPIWCSPIHCWWTFPYTKIKWKQIWYLYFLPGLLGSEWCDCKSCIWDWLLVSIVYSLHTQCCRRMKNKNINGNRFYLRHINTFGISMEQA